MHPASLAALRERLRDDLVATSYPRVDWVRPLVHDGEVALNCAIIGAGQMGLTIAAGLAREHVAGVALFDRARKGREGPWRTFARMETLRTPKIVTGTELGLPSLGFRAWWIAQHGLAGWNTLGRIPRTAWMDYLDWYREVMALDVRNEHDLVAIEPLGPALFRLVFDTPDGRRAVTARNVVLATGSEGGGGHAVPPFIANAVPRDRVCHTNDHDVDFTGLQGKRIGILGAGASAFDFAIAALRSGALSVDLCFRRPALPLENPRRWMETPGFLAAYGALADARKWAYMRRLYDIGQPPPLPTFERATSSPGFRLHPGTPWETCALDGDEIVVASGERRFRFDVVVAGTGITADLDLRCELDAIRGDIALWRDRYAPPADLRQDVLASFPYLGRSAQFTEKAPGNAPYLSRIHYLARPATLSMGPVAASNSALKYVGPQVVRGIVETLLLDQERADWDDYVGRQHLEQPVETVS